MELIALTLAYLLGGIPFAFLVVRYRQGIDIRTVGSGNVGATNALRTAGKLWGITTLLLDAGKGYAAVWLALTLTGSILWAAAAASVAVAGHVFPIYLRFRGGKGVATSFGAFLALAPGLVLLCAFVFLAAVAIWRYVSVGSMLSAAAFPVLGLLWRADWAIVGAGAACAVLVVFKHADNLQRLSQGTENRLVFARK